MGNLRQKRTFTDSVLLVFKGIAMGAANKVPGVSGGIVAFVAGFYEELIFSLQRLNFKAFRLLLNQRYKSFWEYVNGKFIILLFSGTIFSYFSVSLLLDYLITNYERFVLGGFFGMIVASLYYIFKQTERWSYDMVIGVTTGIILGLVISFAKPVTENDDLLFVFFCGIISVSGMTLPGLSGSFILIILGNYNLLLVDSVNNVFYIITSIFQWNFDFINDMEQMRLLRTLLFFSLGSIAGLVLFSNLLSYVLKKHHQLTVATIIGFIIGTVRTVWPWKDSQFRLDSSGKVTYNSVGNPEIVKYDFFIPDFTNLETWCTIGFILLGIVIIVLLETYGEFTRK